MCTSYKDILSSYIQQKYIEETDLDKIDPQNSNMFVPLNQIYLGVSLMNLENQPAIKNRIDSKDLLCHFRTRCQRFLAKLSQEMRKRFDFSSDSPYAKMQCLHRRVALSCKDPKRPISIVNLAISVPRILDPENTQLLQKIDDQWRKMSQREFPIEYKDMKNDEFWGNISDLKNLQDEHEFKELGKFALDVLALPFSNASCERIFSKVNLIKTKLRNKLQTDTINGLILTSQHVKAGMCTLIYSLYLLRTLLVVYLYYSALPM